MESGPTAIVRPPPHHHRLKETARQRKSKEDCVPEHGQDKLGSLQGGTGRQNVECGERNRYKKEEDNTGENHQGSCGDCNTQESDEAWLNEDIKRVRKEQEGICGRKEENGWQRT